MRLFAYLPPYKFYIFLALIAMVAAAAGSSLMALLMGKLTDLGFYQKNGLVAIWAPIALIGFRSSRRWPILFFLFASKSFSGNPGQTPFPDV